MQSELSKCRDLLNLARTMIPLDPRFTITEFYYDPQRAAMVAYIDFINLGHIEVSSTIAVTVPIEDLALRTDDDNIVGYVLKKLRHANSELVAFIDGQAKAGGDDA
jgi:hypothetical protein